MSDEIAKQIEQDVRDLEQHNVVTGGIRKNIVDKLTTAVLNMQLDPDQEKASAIDAKMGVVNTLLKALSDQDNQKTDLIKLKQKIQSSHEKEDTLKVISATVSSFIQQLDTRINIVFDEHASKETLSNERDALLDDIAKNTDIQVLDTELEFSTGSAKELNTDS